MGEADVFIGFDAGDLDEQGPECMGGDGLEPWGKEAHNNLNIIA